MDQNNYSENLTQEYLTLIIHAHQMKDLNNIKVSENFKNLFKCNSYEELINIIIKDRENQIKNQIYKDARDWSLSR